MLTHLPPPEVIAAIVLVTFFAIGIHEYAHCKVADMAGDPTPGIYGRVTLNLFKHFEPVGTLMMVVSALAGFGIGWGRAAPIDPSKMRNPRWDTFATVAAGPLSNLLQAVIYAIGVRVGLRTGAVSIDQLFGALGREHTTFLAAVLGEGVLLNLSLFIFNLIPLGPLDGHWLVAAFLPEKVAYHWRRWHRQYGRTLLILLVLLPGFNPDPRFDIIGRIIVPPLVRLFSILTGVPVG